MALLFAFSIQEQVEKYGAYVGLAAFLGLAVLTVLYFAQARELKRLRDWAGRAPERAQEVEALATARAEELRRAPEPAPERSGTVGPAQPVAQPAAAPAPSGNGRGTGAPIPIGPRPAVAVAAAAARAAEAGAVATEDAPEPAEDESPEPVVAPAADATQVHPAPVELEDADEDTGEEAAAEAAPATREEEAAAPSGNGTGEHPPVIPRATPRPQPRPEPAAPLRAPTASRTAPAPPRRPVTAARDGEGSSRAGRVTAMTLGGILAVALLAFAAIQLFGGGDDTPKAAPNVAQSPTASTNSGNGGSASTSDQRPDTVVTVLNGTPTQGLAGTTRDKLVKAGYSDESGMVRTGNNTDQQRQDSAVFYASGQRRMARDVAQVLGITTRPEPIDPDTQALANNTGEGAAGHETDIVVIVGADQASP